MAAPSIRYHSDWNIGQRIEYLGSKTFLFGNHIANDTDDGFGIKEEFRKVLAILRKKRPDRTRAL